MYLQQMQLQWKIYNGWIYEVWSKSFQPHLVEIDITNSF